MVKKIQAFIFKKCKLYSKWNEDVSITSLCCGGIFCFSNTDITAIVLK